MKRSYETEVKRLEKAITIALESYQKFPPKGISETAYNLIIKCTNECLVQCLNPEQQYSNLSSLKYVIDEVFTYFQEGHGETVEYFWRRISEEGLGYVRVNRVEKVLKRGRIVNKQEYDFVTDTMVPYLQGGMITEVQFASLQAMVAVYEGKGLKKG